MTASADKVCVGAIAGSFGVRGDVRLKSFCANPEDIANYSPLLSEDGTRRFAIRITGAVKGGFSARVEGVGSKEAADALRGTRLYAPRAALPDLPDDEYYHADLIGLTVVDTGGATLGTVRAVLNHGATDLLEVFAPGRRSTVLLPFTTEAVPTIDIGAGRIIADPPEGLFD